MSLFSPADRRLAQEFVDHASANPFLQQRIDIERQILGRDFLPTTPIIHLRTGQSITDAFPNVAELLRRKTDLARRARQTLVEQGADDPEELRLYEGLALSLIYSTHVTPLERDMANPFRNKSANRRIDFWPQFAEEFNHLLRVPGIRLPSNFEPDHIFACFFQFHRAFRQIYNHIIGSSLAAARLRASVWESLFTHDLLRYARVLYRRMANVTTLITGPSGSGKELVARAIAFSQYIAFDPRSQMFARDFTTSHHPVNLAALPVTLIESELFGHKKGAFTGATADRKGWLETAEASECVFLDEIGELEGSVQVKLLRVLQERKFHRLGDSKERNFAGKITAATNRDLAVEMRDGRFREDLYYRLCSDVIHTPSLDAQLVEAPRDLPIFVRFIVDQMIGDVPTEADLLSDEITSWIEENLPSDYRWPGNIRELEQCVRNVMIRRQYRPAIPSRTEMDNHPRDAFLANVASGTLSRDELLPKYYALVVSKSDSYQEAARRLGVDWRTVKNRVDGEFLREINEATPDDAAE